MGAECGIEHAEFNECAHSMLFHKYRIAIECRTQESGEQRQANFRRLNVFASHLARMSAIISQFTCKCMCGDVCVRCLVISEFDLMNGNESNAVTKKHDSMEVFAWRAPPTFAFHHGR